MYYKKKKPIWDLQIYGMMAVTFKKIFGGVLCLKSGNTDTTILN